jgi:hypothetical protein
VGIPISEIVASFKGKNCILLLGPGLAIDKKGTSLLPGLINYFKQKQLDIEEDIDNLCFYKKQTRTRACGYLKSIVETIVNRAICTDGWRAFLPPLRFNQPDLLMKQALEDYGKVL